MSRIGQTPIELPSGVKVDLKGRAVTVTGPKGTVAFVAPRGTRVTSGDDSLEVTVEETEIDTPGAWGLARSLIANGVTGVTQGFEKQLQLIGVGYRAEVEGKGMTLNVGFSHPVKIAATEGIEFSVETTGSILAQGDTQPMIPIVVRGVDKQLVGQIAANIRAVRPPEPYKGKGIRYLGERVRTDKTGKAAA